MEPRSQEYDSWDKLVKKTVAVEAKASLQPSYYSRNMDNCCPKGNYSSHTTLSKPQSAWEPCDEFSDKTQTHQAQNKSTPSNSSRLDSGETSGKKARKEKKKKYHQEHKNDSGTPATGVNADNVASGRAPKELSHITCFNCDKKGHYADKYPERRKDRDTSEDL